MRRRLLAGSGSIGIVAAAAAVAGLVAAPPTLAAAKAPAVQAAPVGHVQLGQGGRVIVLLRNTTTRYTAHTAQEQSQAASARATLAGLTADIHSSGGSVSSSYSIINGLSARVSESEARSLAANPAVKEVVPDGRMTLPQSSQPTMPQGARAQKAIDPPANTCKPSGVQLEPQALEATHADSDVPGALTARSLGYTGKGVTVGWIADGLDPNNPDFMRNGKSIFSDYQDFSGDGPGAPTNGDEAFLDASAIAAQGNKTYNISHFSELPLDTACKIRVEGEAPGVKLVGLNVFGNEEFVFDSTLVQAIQYATTVDHVNVLNESIGSNPFPDDDGALDSVKAANDAATKLGVTITVSSGDAGVTNTIGSSSTDPKVLSVGGSTTYRFYLQTGYGGARLPGITGYLNNNISALSSSGFDEDGNTVSLVAPGDLNWAVCDAKPKLFAGCVNFRGQPSDLEESGGTSEAAPVTAGVAALVIQAYRQGHDGDSPTPAVVKKILTSTADDIDAPAEQQGAGLVDAYKAVQLAKSYNATPTGHTILSSAGSFSATAAPSTPETFTDTVTNEGTTAQTITPSARELVDSTRLKTTSVVLNNKTSPKYVDFQGIKDNYEKVTFTVPAGEDRLNASIAFQNASLTDLAARVRMDLVDPNGNLASYSLPQGNGNYGNSQVAEPTPGTWTAYIESRVPKQGGTTGKVQFAASASKFGFFGTVSPSSLSLQPGQSGQVTLTTSTLKTPGDKAGSLVLTSSATDTGISATTTVPVTMRSLIPAGTQSFQQTLTGGNGRSTATGEEFYYATDVAKGTPELTVSATLADNPNNPFYAFLISPEGQQIGGASNQVLRSKGGIAVGVPELGAQMHIVDPEPGRWTVILVFAPTVSGTAIKEPFTVSTNDTAVPASAAGLPTSAKTVLKKGTSKTVDVKVKNTGSTPEAFFVDPRLNTSKKISLTSLSSAKSKAPYHYGQSLPFYLVPSLTTRVGMTSTTTGHADLQFDSEAAAGDPDVLSTVGTTAHASYAAGQVAPGEWDIAPTEVGPYATQAKNEKVTSTMTARTAPFDKDAVPSTGDLWQIATDPSTALHLVTVGPGKTATIPVTITAKGKPRTVHGTLYVDSADLFYVFGGTAPNGNTVAALPYTYKVK